MPPAKPWVTIELWSHSKLKILHDISMQSIHSYYGNVCIMLETRGFQPFLARGLLIVWCLTKFMLTTITDFDTALVMDKNSSMNVGHSIRL